MVQLDRWAALTGSMYMELLSGSFFAFPVISTDLKAILRTDQAGISWIIIAGVTGMTLGQPPAGALFDNSAYGPRVVAQGGALMSAAGFFCMWLLSTGLWGKGETLLPYCCLFIFFAYAGLGWVDTAASNLQAVNFALDKGLAVGITKAVAGLSGAVLVIITYSTGLSSSPTTAADGQINVVGAAACTVNGQFVAAGNATRYQSDAASGVADGSLDSGIGVLLFLALQALFLGGTAGNVVRVISGYNLSKLGKGGRMKMRLYYVVVVLMLALCTISSAFIRNADAMSNNAIVILLGIVFFGPVLILLATKGSTRSATINASFLQAHQSRLKRRADRNSVTPADSLSAFHRSVKPGSLDGGAYSVHDWSLYDALFKLDHWLLHLIWWGLAAGEVNVQQLAQINSAAGGSREDLASTLIVAGVCSCLGRMTIAPLSDVATRWGVTRPLLACVMLVGIVISHVILAAGGGIVTALVFSGFCTGALWSLLTPIVLEVVGPSKFATVYTFTYLSFIMALLFYQQGVVAPIYETALSAQQARSPGSHTCCGAACFQLAHIVVGAVTALHTVGVFVLHLRTKHFYDAMEVEKKKFQAQKLEPEMALNRVSESGGGGRGHTLATAVAESSPAEWQNHLGVGDDEIELGLSSEVGDLKEVRVEWKGNELPLAGDEDEALSKDSHGPLQCSKLDASGHWKSVRKVSQTTLKAAKFGAITKSSGKP